MFFRDELAEPKPKNYGLRALAYTGVAIATAATAYALGAVSVAAAMQVGATSILDAVVTGGAFMLPAAGMAGGAALSTRAAFRNVKKMSAPDLSDTWVGKTTDRVLDAKDEVSYRMSDMAFNLKYQFIKATRADFREARRQQKIEAKAKAAKQKAHKKMAQKAVKEAIKTADKQMKPILKEQKKRQKAAMHAR